MGNLHKLVSKNKKPLTEDEISRSPDLRIGALISDRGNKFSKERIPSVGHYNSDILLSMGYKVAKNVNRFNTLSAPFNSIEKRFLNISKKNSTGTIGPGQYYKDKNRNDRDINYNNSPPFNTSSERNCELVENKYRNGPGSYNTGSDFDWNKKTYNIQYI